VASLAAIRSAPRAGRAFHLPPRARADDSLHPAQHEPLQLDRGSSPAGD
ncbi:MAG: Light-harvesting LHI, alpha subunit, partial [uncultured Gemmatimonadaceae bacterium]